MDPSNWAIPWAQVAKGLAEYRTDNYARAADLCDKVLRVRVGRVHDHVRACLVRAMALHRLRDPEAHNVLSDASRSLDQIAACGAKLPLGERIVLRFLHREAETLFSSEVLIDGRNGTP